MGAVIISIDHPVYFPRSGANPISADTACDQRVINSTHFPFYSPSPLLLDHLVLSTSSAFNFNLLSFLPGPIFDVSGLIFFAVFQFEILKPPVIELIIFQPYRAPPACPSSIGVTSSGKYRSRKFCTPSTITKTYKHTTECDIHKKVNKESLK